MSSSSSFLPPAVVNRLSREVRDLLKSPFPVQVDTDSGLPSNLQQLTVELEGPADTPYEGKFFLLRIVAGYDFPSVPPAVHFLTKVYHPNVDPVTGAVSLNEDAGRLLMESYDEYCNRARLHADVHGRVQSIATKETAYNNSSSSTEDCRVLQTSSRNTASTGSISSPNTLTKKGGKNNKTAMSKKKSLKRL